MDENQQEKKHLFYSAFVPVCVVVTMWLIYIVDLSFQLNLSRYGIMARTIEGLVGVITMPLLHGNWEHLLSNTIPVLVLGTALYYFYGTIANRVMWLTWLISGFLTWCIADEGLHVGASALIYGLNLFLIVSGLIRGNSRLLAISFIMIFLYGSFMWGVFPSFTEPLQISWQGHLAGLLTGCMLAFFYRKDGPQKEEHHWEDEDTDDDTDDDHDQDNDTDQDDDHDSTEPPYWDVPQPDKEDLTVIYRFRH